MRSWQLIHMLCRWRGELAEEGVPSSWVVKLLRQHHTREAHHLPELAWVAFEQLRKLQDTMLSIIVTGCGKMALALLLQEADMRAAGAEKLSLA